MAAQMAHCSAGLGPARASRLGAAARPAAISGSSLRPVGVSGTRALQSRVPRCASALYLDLHAAGVGSHKGRTAGCGVLVASWCSERAQAPNRARTLALAALPRAAARQSQALAFPACPLTPCSGLSCSRRNAPQWVAQAQAGGGSGGSSGGSGLGGGGGGGDDEPGKEKKPAFGWKGWQDRVAADPQFVYKVVIEQVIGVSASVLGDMASRPNWGLDELDFVFATLVVSCLEGRKEGAAGQATPARGRALQAYSCALCMSASQQHSLSCSTQCVPLPSPHPCRWAPLSTLR
jgi:hypothetical protein